jgi:hypothetical protein
MKAIGATGPVMDVVTGIPGGGRFITGQIQNAGTDLLNRLPEASANPITAGKMGIQRMRKRHRSMNPRQSRMLRQLEDEGY